MDDAPDSRDVAFTPAVKAIQERKGSRASYARAHPFPGRVDAGLAAFLATIETAFLATASADGQPYVQHRGGPPGFIRVLDEETLGFAEYAGNRQYITAGNLSENPRAHLIAMDYANRRRVKIWGTARIVEDLALAARLMPEGYRARPEAALLFTVTAWDVNCPQHIPPLVHAGG